MDSAETQTAVVKLIATELEEGSVLAPHVAAAIAENVMTELLKGKYLIVNGRIHTVASAELEGSADEKETWGVYASTGRGEG